MTLRLTGLTSDPRFHSALNAASYLFELTAITTSYLVLGEMWLRLTPIVPGAVPHWPISGFALSLLLLRGYRIWPAILFGSFLSHALTAQSIIASAAIATGALLSALTGTWLLNRWSNGRDTFSAPLGIIKFVLITFFPVATISAASAAGASMLPIGVSLAHFSPAWTLWWLQDAVATLIIAPAFVLWATTPLSKLNLLDAFIVFSLTIAIAFVAYSPLIHAHLYSSPVSSLLLHRSILGYFVLLPLTWSTIRGHQRDTATAALIFIGFAAWAFSTGTTPFSREDLDSSLFLLFMLSISASIPPLIISAAFVKHQVKENNLLAQQEVLHRQLSEINRALISAKRHFQILIEGVADYAIYIVDRAGRIASWNSAAQKITGYAQDEIIGKHFGILYRPDERRTGEPNHALEIAARSERCEVEGWRIKKNGTPFFVTGSISSLYDDEKQLIGFANIIRDTTERRDAEEKLIQAREQLAMAQKMEAIGKLTGGIAHDFNNLLMIIGGNAQTFKRLLDPKLPKAIEAIQTAAKRGESLTRQLLTFSRRQHLSPTVVDLSASVKDMRTMIQSSLRGNIIYNENIDGDIWPVKVDLAELELAIVNLAVNARDAMPNGGTFALSVSNVTATLEREADHPAGNFVAIKFADTGMGIPPNLLSKIFDPFFTTKEVGKGTGLGLSQVYGFAHQAGGTVSAHSKVGRGTIITIYLPSCAGEKVANNEIPKSDIRGLQQPTVLIVDDSADVAEVTSSLFEHLGYNTVYRDSAEAALTLLAEDTKIDLVFSDIVMPGTIDGVGLASEIRTRYPQLPLILTTGYSDAAQAAPSDLPILRKPFDSETLKTFIQDALGQNTLAQQLDTP